MASRDFPLDERVLISCGLASMPKDDQADILRYLYDEFELRVGTDLSANMSDEELEEFEAIIAFAEGRDLSEFGGRDPCFDWLKEKQPNYRETVHRRYRELLGELWSSAPAIAARLGFPFSQSSVQDLDAFLKSLSSDE